MIDFSTAFQTHIKGESTTLCWCWRLTRNDGYVMGFTEHDEALLIDGINYSASSGLSGAELDAKLGYAIDNNAAEGLLSSDRITATDIDTGLYDSADIVLMRVNWTQPETRADIWRGNFGRITKSGDQFAVDLVGQSAILDRSTGRVFSRMCDARFGDARCGLNGADYPEGVTCGRTFAICRDTFSNTQNYRGFPYLIGDDAMQAGPEGTTRRDGGSRYS